MQEASFFARDGTRVSAWRSSMLPHFTTVLGGLGGVVMFLDLVGFFGSRFALAWVWGPMLSGAVIGIALVCLRVRFL